MPLQNTTPKLHIPMIQATNLQKAYNNVTVLNIPTLTVARGESFGLVGNNGAGKTTFFRLVLDLIEATNGEVMIDGQKVARNDRWKMITGSFLDEGFLIDFLTPEEYFTFVGKLYNKSEGDIAQFIETMQDFFNGEIIGKKKLIREFSKGNQKKIGIAAALLGDPQILILDEPFTALDPSSQIRLKRFLIDLQNRLNMTMLISSHDLNHVTEVCQRIVVLEKGDMVKDLQTNEDTLKELEAYFSV
ncbi:ABC transporter ATP-binding protein [Microbacter margulisiae]|uniref:ABC-2 type transport system ATP-binding protein n=1 Tax=Microbacter margulisiae TaxID=1350067 RepID=A0A7W5H3I9_9PORP|nr:ABC transporter ATP-binding protein [Microbacter margulisiae]MBB3188432.1 ABC-2 type transport system ATP-binding protein [Microbacter margulisiae]